MCARASLLLFVAAAAACTEGAAPTGPEARDFVRLRLVPHFSAGASHHAAAFNHLRLVLRDSATSEILADTTVAVSSTDPQWNVSLNVRLPDREGPVTAVLSIELLNVTAEGTTVEYSDVVTMHLSPGTTDVDVTPAPGPPENRSVTAVRILAPEFLPREGDDVRLETELEGGSDAVRVFWRTLDDAIADVDADGLVSTLLPGTARIIASVGHLEDTLHLSVRQRAVRVLIEPASITVDRVTGEALFSAQVVDARGAMVEGSTVLWSSGDAAVAASLGGGSFRAAARGHTTVHAASAEEPSLQATAALIVQPRAARGVLDATSLTFSALGESRVLTAAFFDAADQPVTGVEVAWTSSAPDVASVDGNGRVAAHTNGSAVVTATLDGVSLTAEVVVAQAAAHITLTPSSLTLLTGESGALSAAAQDANGHAIVDAPLTWASSNDAVATVDDEGNVEGVGPGDATITVSAGDAVAAAGITVESGEPAQLAVISGDGQTAVVGASLPGVLAVEVLNERGRPLEGVAVSWTASDGELVAAGSTDADGIASAQWTLGTRAGTQTVSVSVGVLQASFTALANPGAAARVVVTPSTLTLDAIGASAQLEAAASDEFGNTVATPVTWHSGNEAVATVDEDGTVTATGNGSAHVTAMVGAVSAAATLTVRQRATTLTLTPSERTLRSGESAQLTAVASDAGGHVIADAEITWTSSAPETAAVDDAGLVTALRTGNAVITAASGDAFAVAAITVQPGAPAVLEIVGGADQSVSVGGTLPQPLAVRVLDASGNPLPGIAVGWTTAAGSLDAQTETDDAGVARATWTLGTVAGRHGAAASVGALRADFNATALAGPPATVTVTPTLVTLETLGATASLSATVSDAFGNRLGAAVTWQNSDPAVASVSSTGLVTAIGNGTVLITATAGAASAGATITVAQRAAAIELTPDDVTLHPGETGQLTAVVRDAGGHVIADAAVTWSSSAPATAAVDDAGLVSALVIGDAVITATSGDVSATADIAVEPRTPVVLEVVSGDEQSGTVASALAQPLVVRVTDAGGFPVPGAAIGWTGSGSFAAAAVTDAYGLAQATWTLGTVAGVQSATATVGALTLDFTASAAAGAAAHLVVTPSTVLLSSVGATQALTATVTDAHGNAAADAVVWSTADADIATVSSDGIVAAVANGEVLVTATAGSLSAGATITVAQRAATMALAPDDVTLHPGETEQLTAVVYDAGGHVIADAAVTWTSSAPATAAVDDAGLVSALVIGDAVITATSGDVSATADIAVEPRTPAVLEVVSGDEQSGMVANALAQPLVVRVTDEDGIPVPGAAIAWTGSGSFAAASVTDADGLAQATWTLGTLAGAQTATATVGTLTADFTAVALAPNLSVSAVLPTVLQLLEGETLNVSATVSNSGTAPSGATALRVILRDAVLNTVVLDSVVAVPPIAPSSSVTGAANVLIDNVRAWPTDLVLQLEVDPNGLVTESDEDDNTFEATGIEVTLPVNQLTMLAESTLLSAIDATTVLDVEALDRLGRPVAGTPVWSIHDDDAGVVSVSAAGVVTAVANGTARVIAELDGVADTVEITVLQVAASVVIDPPVSGFINAIGFTTQLTATARDANGHELPAGSIVWTSSGHASVDGTGLVTAVSVGEAVITATAGSVSDAEMITVQQVSASIDIPQEEIALLVGMSASLTASVHDAAGVVIPDADVTWTVVSTDVSGIVDLDGSRVEALAQGNARIRAESGGAEDFVDVTVSLAAGLTHVWNGAQSDDWSVAANWSPASVPGAESVVLIGPSVPNQPRLSSPAAVGGIRIDGGAALDLDGHTLTTTKALEIDGSIVSGTVVLAGPGQPVSGELPDVSVTGTPFASGDVAAASLELAGGELDVRTAHVLVHGVLTGTGGAFRMNNVEGQLQVGGNVTLNAASSTSSLTAGLFRLGGTLDAVGLAPSLGHTMLFDGSSLQTVALGGGHLQNVIFANPAGVELTDAGVAINGGVLISAGTVTGSGNVILRGSLADETDTGWQVSNTTIGASDVTLPAAMKTDLHVALSWTAVAPLELDGSLFITSAQGDVILNGNQITVSGNLVGDQGVFTMLNGADVLSVRGNVTLEHGNTISHLTAGELRIGGDFSVLFNNPPAFSPEGSHTVVMDGSGAQSILTQFPAQVTDRRFFNNLEIRNFSDAGVTFDSGMPVNGTLDVYGTLRIPAERTVDVAGELNLHAGSKLHNFGTLRFGTLGVILGFIDPLGNLPIEL